MSVWKNDTEKTIFSEILRNLRKSVPLFRGAIISSITGFPFAHDLSPGRNPVIMSSMCAEIYNRVSEAAMEIGLKDHNYTISSLDDMMIATFGMGQSLLVTITTERGANIDDIVEAGLKAVERIGNSLSFIQ
ncbi:MAG: hypothetical protein PHH26_04425 [Candidatus Thermoplasmatota archaeon]|nr:hypothetical protein [Candidatus Thermoplasmatota archaeon]